MKTHRLALVAWLLVGGGGACIERRPPPPPGGGGGGSGSVNPRRDAGSDRGVSDAGRDDAIEAGADAATPPGCVHLDGDAPPPVLLVSEPESARPLPFVPRYAYVAWRPASCDPPPSERWLLLGLNQDGCTPGTGVRFETWFRAEQIGLTLTPGPLPAAFSEHLRVEFAREDSVGNEALWCNGPGALGEVTLESLGNAAGDTLRFQLDTQLPGCGPQPPEVPIRVQGTLEGIVPAAFETACTR